MSKSNRDDPANIEALQRLFEDDVQSLLELTFTNGPVKERNVRLASVLVRRWLCDNEIGKLTRHYGVVATIPVLDDKKYLELVQLDLDADYYLSAGVKFDGVPLWFLYHSNSEAPPDWALKLERPSVIDMKLSKALSRPVLYFEGETFGLDEVLRFVCNKLGGAHFDISRNERQGKLEEAARFLTFGPPVNDSIADFVGTVHLPLERSGSEVLSGLSVAVIVAATMLLNIKFDGNPMLEFEFDG